MSGKYLYIFMLALCLVSLHPSAKSKKVVIHVPYRVKNVKHTHTIYKVVPHHHEARNDDDDGNYAAYRRR